MYRIRRGCPTVVDMIITRTVIVTASTGGKRFGVRLYTIESTIVSETCENREREGAYVPLATEVPDIPPNR